MKNNGVNAKNETISDKALEFANNQSLIMRELEYFESMQLVDKNSEQYRKDLSALEQRLKTLLNTLESDNRYIENKLESELNLLEERVEKTYREMTKLAYFTEKMKEWSRQFFSSPKKCSLVPLSESDSSDLESGISSSSSTVHNIMHTMIDENVKSILIDFQTIEENVNHLFAACLNEIEYSKELLAMYGDDELGKYKRRAVSQEASLKATQSELKSSMSRWLVWQKNMIRYLEKSKIRNNLQVQHESKKLEGGKYVFKQRK